MSKFDVETYSKEQLVEISKVVKERLVSIERLEIREKVKNNPDTKLYSFIIYVDENCDGALMLGFNRNNSPGYIDDHIPEDQRELYYEILSSLPIVPWESYSCTYEINEKNRKSIEEAAAYMGIKIIEPSWE